MNEFWVAVAVGAAFGAGQWWGRRSVCRELARFAVRNPVGFLAFALRVTSFGERR